MTEQKNERKLVIPGETIVSGDDYLPGDFTRKEGNDIISNRYGLAEISGRVVKIIPVSQNIIQSPDPSADRPLKVPQRARRFWIRQKSVP